MQCLRRANVKCCTLTQCADLTPPLYDGEDCMACHACMPLRVIHAERQITYTENPNEVNLNIFFATDRH